MLRAHGVTVARFPEKLAVPVQTWLGPQQSFIEGNFLRLQEVVHLYTIFFDKMVQVFLFFLCITVCYNFTMKKQEFLENLKHAATYRSKLKSASDRPAGGYNEKQTRSNKTGGAVSK